jgi:hypothetical protein
MVGLIKVKSNNAVITLHPDNPLDLVAIRTPPNSRSTKDYIPLSSEEEDTAIEEAKDILRKGVPLMESVVPDKSLLGYYIHLKEDSDGEEYYVMKKGKVTVSWEKLRTIVGTMREVVPEVFSPTEKLNDETYLKAMTTGLDDGIQKNCWSELDKMILSLDSRIIQRVLRHIGNPSSEVRLPSLSRDGDGLKEGADIYDTLVNEILLKICMWFPAAIRPRQYHPATYKVLYGPLLWKIAKRFATSVRSKDKNTHKKWSQSQFHDSRTPYKYQEEMVAKLIYGHDHNKKGSFVYLRVGAGKTKIVLTYLEELHKRGALPKYIIYTLPKKAVGSIIEEIDNFGIKAHGFIPLSNPKPIGRVYSEAGHTYSSTELVPYKINMVEHDHLIKKPEILLEVMAEALLIVDEVHFMLNASKRTAIGISMSRACKEFVVMTGTPLVDNKTEKLMPWLDQIVSFEIVKDNFWTAMNSMVHKNVSTGIVTEDVYTLAKFTSEEREKYGALVPPGLGGTSKKSNSGDIMKAIKLCILVALRTVVSQTLKYLKNGRRVFVVVDTFENAEYVRAELLKKYKGDILVIRDTLEVPLTETNVAKGKTLPYNVVISTLRGATSYTLTYLNVMITTVYPSNEASREQARGRINRIGQLYGKRESGTSLTYDTVHLAILTELLRNHKHAKNLVSAINSITKQLESGATGTSGTAGYTGAMGGDIELVKELSDDSTEEVSS